MLYYRLGYNDLGDTGALEGIKHYVNIKELEWAQ